MMRLLPANACEKSSAASELLSGVLFVPGVSLLNATKPPLETCITSWRFAGFCAAAATPKQCMTSRRIQSLLLIRRSSFDNGEFDLVCWFEAVETCWNLIGCRLS